MSKDLRKFVFSNPDYIITHTKEVYTRTSSGRSWKKKPDKVKTEIIPAAYYTNYITSVPFFNNLGYCRASYNYTSAGYLPVSTTNISPDKTEKHLDRFSFMPFPMRYAKRDGGFRENDILENLSHYEHYMDGEHELFKFYHKDGEHAAVYDKTYYKWVY